MSGGKTGREIFSEFVQLSNRQNFEVFNLALAGKIHSCYIDCVPLGILGRLYLFTLAQLYDKHNLETMFKILEFHGAMFFLF